MVTRSVTGVVVDVKRVGMSRSGNPTMVVTFSDGRTYLTGMDSQVAFTVESHVGHEVVVRVSHGRVTGLTCDCGA